MSKERDLLKKILATGWLNNELSNEVEELLAQPERKSFSDEEITKAFTKSVFGTWDSKSYRSGFKDAEKAHGITGEDDETK